MAILAPYAENPIRDPSPYRRGGGGGGAGLGFYTLLEDVDSSFFGLVRVWAVAATETGVKTGTPTKVTSWEGIIDGAKAGYLALYANVGGQKVFVQGPCITPCNTDGELTVGVPDDAIVGEGWEHTITASGASELAEVSYEDLPSWVTASGSYNNVLSGTPSSEDVGVYYVIVSIEAPGVGASAEDECILTKVLVITVVEPEE